LTMQAARNQCVAYLNLHQQNRCVYPLVRTGLTAPTSIKQRSRVLALPVSLITPLSELTQVTIGRARDPRNRPVHWARQIFDSRPYFSSRTISDALWYSVAEPVKTESGHQNGHQTECACRPDSQAGFGVHFGVRFSFKPGRFGGFPRLWRLRQFPLSDWESAK
jgi:hypothetical protein